MSLSFLLLAIVGAIGLFGLFAFWSEPLWLLPGLERLTPNIVYRVRTRPYQDAGNEGRVRYSASAREVGNSKIEIGRSRGAEPPPPTFFVTAHSKGVTASICVTAHSKGLTDGQFRPKPGKTRCLLVTAHSKGLTPTD